MCEYPQTIGDISISTPKFSLTKRTASVIAKKESLLQHLGPPTVPIASSDLAVILFDKPKFAPPSGVDPEMIEMKIPLLIPAPQAPHALLRYDSLKICVLHKILI